MSKKIFSALLVLLLVAPAAPAQQTPAPAPPPGQDEETIRVGSTAVQVDVVVTDKAGRRITGLTADDFQVVDENKPVALDFFAAIEGSRLSRAESRAGGTSQPASPAAAQSALLRPYPGRHVALVVDDTSMSPETFTRTRASLSDYVNSKLTPSDMAAVISLGGRMGTSQQFTNDKQRLLSAINRLAASGRSPQVRDQFNLSYAEAVRINAGDTSVLTAVARRASATSLANQSSSGSIADQSRVGGGGISGIGVGGATQDEEGGIGASDESILRARIKTAAQARIGELASDARNTIQALSSLFRSMADLPGRKVVMLLSESFVTLGGSSEDQTNQITQLIELARRSGVSVYALDAGGLRTNSPQATEQITGVDIRALDLAGGATFSDFENMSAARMVAYGTGGTLISNTNDIVGGLERASEDSSSYYVIGFRPAALDNKFHRLAVTVKGKPDLVVRTRRGYLAVNQESVRGTPAELAAAIMSPVPYIDLPLDVVARVVPQGGGQSVQLGFHVGRNYLSLPAPDAADKTAAYELIAAVFAAGNDDPVGGIKRTLTFDLSKPEERQRLAGGGLLFVPQPLTLPPGQYQIRAVMREKASGAVGSSYQFFEVPNTADRKAVTMSSVMLNEAGKVEFSGTHSFKRAAGEIDVRYIVYNLPKDAAAQLTQQVRLLDSQGRVLMDSPLPLATAEAPPGVFHQGTRLKLPPARGRYALVIKLSDKRGKVEVERRADFVVE